MHDFGGKYRVHVTLFGCRPRGEVRRLLYSNPRSESTIIIQVELIFISRIGVQLGLANVSFRRISNLSEIRVNFTKYYLHVITVSKWRTLCHHQKRERWHSSSIGSLGFCTSCAVWAVAPVAHCQALEYVICSFYEISLPATSALFFFRVRAVYNDNKIVTVFFGALWFSVLVLSIFLMLAVRSGE